MGLYVIGSFFPALAARERVNIFGAAPLWQTMVSLNENDRWGQFQKYKENKINYQ